MSVFASAAPNRLARAALAAALTAALGVGLGLGAQARADEVADFYEGRNITLLVPASPGGVYGTFALFLERHMKRHMPGHPNILLEYMTGAGGTKALNYLYNVARRDGTVLATPLTGVVITPVLRPEQVRYDPTEFNYLGGWGEAVTVLSLLKPAAIRTLDDAKKTEVVLGALGKATASYQVPAMLNDMLGTKFKLITGYRGGTPIRAAMEKGEVDGWAGLWLGWKGRKPEWVAQDKLLHLFQIATKRARDLPDVPLLTEFAQTEEQRKIFAWQSNAGLTAWTLAAPPGVPEERLAAIEEAYMATLRDPAFLADAKKRNYPIDPVSAAEVRAAVKEVTSLEPALLAKAKKAMGFE